MVSVRRRLVLYFLAVVAVVYTLLPLYDVFSVSLMNESQVLQEFLFPPTPSLHNFLLLFGFKPFQEALLVREGIENSVITAVSVMVITLAAAIPGGYALGRLKFRAGQPILMLVIGSRMIPPLTVLLPYYFFFNSVGLRGTIPGLVIIQMSITVPIVTWVLMGFFSALPRDVEQNARLDGCTRLQAFRYALLPLASPGIAASAVMAFLFSWNDYLYSLILTSGTPAQTLNAFISDLDGSLLAAAVVVQVVVAIVLGAFLQRYITSLKIVDPGTISL